MVKGSISLHLTDHIQKYEHQNKQCTTQKRWWRRWLYLHISLWECFLPQEKHRRIPTRPKHLVLSVVFLLMRSFCTLVNAAIFCRYVILLILKHNFSLNHKFVQSFDDFLVLLRQHLLDSILLTTSPRNIPSRMNHIASACLRLVCLCVWILRIVCPCVCIARTVREFLGLNVGASKNWMGGCEYHRGHCLALSCFL